MINNYTYQVLPFYDSVSKQNFKQAWMYDDLCSASLICPQNRLLPFQVSRSSRYNPYLYINLYCFDGTFIKNLITDINAYDLKIYTAGGVDYYSQMGNWDLAVDLDAGLYYLMVSDGITNKYSEVFKVVCFDFDTSHKPVYINPEAQKLSQSAVLDIELK